MSDRLIVSVLFNSLLNADAFRRVSVALGTNMRFRIIPFLLLLFSLAANAATPEFLQLKAGKKIKVVGITETTLHQSEQPVIVLRYQTDTDFGNIKFVAQEVEDVWVVFQKIADEKGYKAAIVEAAEKRSAFARGASWVWKKGNDGRWNRPDSNDQALVPNDRILYKIGK